jgi:ComF family protein
LIHLLFPATCRLCLEPGQAPTLDLCRGCEQDFPRNERACPVCAAALPHRAGSCPGCSADAPRGFDRAFAPYRYEFPLVELIHELKYGGQLATARILGTLLGRRIAECGRPAVDALVPVPLFARREARRGFNQAHEIAVFASAQLRLPVIGQLARRMRDTAPQAQLPAAERRDNLKNAFIVKGLPPPRVAIVDDVLTTGATAEALAFALRRAGCRYVEVWTIARA